MDPRTFPMCSVLTVRLTVFADLKLIRSLIIMISLVTQFSTAVSHQVRDALGTAQIGGNMMMLCVVKVKHFPCPLTATTQTAASNVTILIKTVRILVDYPLITLVPTPVLMSMKTCAEV